MVSNDIMIIIDELERIW